MTDEQLVNAVAVEVLGWKKSDAAPCSGHVWADKDDCWHGAVEDCCVNDNGTYREPFDPLHDHNHTALPRAKMREMGYAKQSRDWIRKGNPTTTEIVYHRWNTIWAWPAHTCAYEDELHAEVCAMIEAVRKNRKENKHEN